MNLYVLTCPKSGSIRYVGKTVDLKTRLTHHISEARKKSNHRECWISSLAVEGLRPNIRLLTQVPDEQANFWEREYIKLLRGIGCPLTNGTDGGDDPPSRRGVPVSLETRRKMSEAQKRIGNKPPSPRGRKLSPETCLKHSERQLGPKNHMYGRRGKDHPRFGVKASPETRAKQRAAKLGKRKVDVEIA